MRKLSDIVQYEFLKPIESFPLDKDQVFMSYCSREKTPYFAKTVYNKGKGFNFIPRSYDERMFSNYPTNISLINGLATWYALKEHPNKLTNIRFYSIEDMKKDHIYSWCSLLDFMKSILAGNRDLINLLEDKIREKNSKFEFTF